MDDPFILVSYADKRLSAALIRCVPPKKNVRNTALKEITGQIWDLRASYNVRYINVTFTTFI